MVEEPALASYDEPYELRLEDLQFGEPKPTLPHMDLSVFHIEDYLHDLFALGPTNDLLWRKLQFLSQLL